MCLQRPTHTWPPHSLCTFSLQRNGRFPRVINTCQVPVPPFTNTHPHTNAPIIPLPRSSQHLPHTLAISLYPKAPARPHLAMPKWAASALAVPGPSGALDSWVCVCVCESTGPALCGHSQPFKLCQGSRCWERLGLTQAFVCRHTQTQLDRPEYCIIPGFNKGLREPHSERRKTLKQNQILVLNSNGNTKVQEIQSNTTWQ